MTVTSGADQIGKSEQKRHGESTHHLPNERTGAKRFSVATRLFPIIFFITYLTATVLVFAYGPWPYPVANGTKLFLFLAFAHLALLAGYLLAAFSKPHGYSGRLSVSHLVIISIVANLLLFLPTSLFRTGSLLPPVASALQNLGDAYSESRVLRQVQTPLIEYIRAVFGPLLALLLPLTVYYWRQLSVRIKIVALTTIVANTMIGVAMGVNRELFFTLFLTVWLYFASYLAGSRKFKWPRPKYIIAGTLATLIFFSFFLNAMLTRSGGQRSFYFASIDAYADTDNPLLRHFPAEIQVGVAGLASYLSQGYYALYLSLEQPFEPMYGVGNSMFLTRQAIRLTGIAELADRSYPDRIMIENGWNSYGNYTSIYPWIASDVSFPGTVLIMALIGMLMGLAWLDTLRGRNPFAVVMFGQFSIMMATVPTVNWVVNSGEGFTTFWTLLLVWLATRYRWTWRRQEVE